MKQKTACLRGYLEVVGGVLLKGVSGSVKSPMNGILRCPLK